MTHVNIFSGTADGGVAPRELDLIRVLNQNVIGTKRLEYVATDTLTLTRVTNTNTFGEPELDNIIVSTLGQTHVTNSQTFGGPSLALLPFVPVNYETVALLVAYTGIYSTTAKIQIDTNITGLKDAGVWTGLDWYGNAFWALNEHDALLNWKDPSQTLTKVGGASWALAAGLSGVNPVTSSGRYKSGATPAGGPNSTPTSFAFFAKITAIAVPQSGMQPIGNFQLSSPGPSAPDGSFLQLSPGSTGSAGANVLPFNGNTGFTVGDGLGVWGVSRNGGTNITVKDGSTLDTDAVSGVATYHNAEGMCVVGTPVAFGAGRSFPGTILYWGWGAAMTAAEFADVEASFVASQLPPSAGGAPDDSLLTDTDGNWLAVNGSGDYLKTR